MLCVGILCAFELHFHFSERPLLESNYDIEIKRYRKDEKHMLAQSVEDMYEVSGV
jgi:hypothetical protein